MPSVVVVLVIMHIYSCNYEENLTPGFMFVHVSCGVIMTTMICLNMQGDLQNGEMMVKEKMQINKYFLYTCH
jgi:hypothetical protein